jgi:phage-related protein
LHGEQEVAQFHAYYDHSCYLPLYVFAGKALLACLLRPSRIDGAKHAAAIVKLLATRLRQAWLETRIIVRADAGFCRQRLIRDAAKVLKGFGGAGVLEVVEDDEGGTYRAVYTVRFEEAVFVLHCFQKKSKRGIATPKQDMEIIRARLKVAEAMAKEMKNGKAHH